MLKRVLLILLASLLLVQVFRPTKNLSSTAPAAGDFIVRFKPPAEIAAALRTGCYDCHSNNTRYPWYANVQPLGWWLAFHVRDGKKSLNLSEFSGYTPKLQARKLNQMSDQIANREMPLPSYLWIHRDARLTDSQVAKMSEWLDNLHDQVATPE